MDLDPRLSSVGGERAADAAARGSSSVGGHGATPGESPSLRRRDAEEEVEDDDDDNDDDDDDDEDDDGEDEDEQSTYIKTNHNQHTRSQQLPPLHQRPHHQDSSSGSGSAAQSAAAAAAADDAKKPRACEACRGLKVRCEPDPHDETAPCRRCRKAGRSCVVTMPTRKRQKKTDSRVAELEKKIDALTATLQARGSGSGSAATLASIGGLQQQQQGQYGGQSGQQAMGPSSSGGYGSVAMEDAPATVTAPAAPWGAAVSSPWKGSATPPGRTHTPGMGEHSRQDRGSAGQQHSQYTAPEAHKAGAAAGAGTATNSTSAAGHKRKHSEAAYGGERAGGPAGPGYPSAPPAGTSNDHPSLSEYKSLQGDLIDRGIMTMEQAAGYLARYNEDMVPHLPAVILPPGMTAMALRRERPVLFLSIMAAASFDATAAQRVLQREMVVTLAERVMVAGEKSMELVQALLVNVIWYWPPENFEELRFYQLIHLAAIMSIDLGLGQRAAQRRGLRSVAEKLRVSAAGSGGGPGAHPLPSAAAATTPGPGPRRAAPPDPLSIEGRRTWLACYYLTMNTAMALHRPALVRWSPFMADSIKVLEESPDAAPTDAYFCHLVWTHRVSEETMYQFSIEDPTTQSSFVETRSQYVLRGIQRQLDEHQANVRPGLLQPTLRISFETLRLYMHEMALQSRAGVDGEDDPMRSIFAPESIVTDAPGENGGGGGGGGGGDKLTPTHASAIGACVAAIDSLHATFLDMDVASARCMPVFNFVRVAYALVILIKIYIPASAPGSELGRVVDVPALRVDARLDALLSKFRQIASEERSRPAAKILIVVAMLRTWFAKHTQSEGKEGNGGAASGAAGAPALGTPQPQHHQYPHQQQHQHQQHQHPHQNQYQQQQQQQQRSMSTAPLNPVAGATPLRLLSEVATGSGSTPNGSGSGSGSGPSPGPESGVHRAMSANRWGFSQPSQPFFSNSGSDRLPPPQSSSPIGMPPPSTPGSHIDTNSITGLGAAMPPLIPPLSQTTGGGGGTIPAASYAPLEQDLGVDWAAIGLSNPTNTSYEDGMRIFFDSPWFDDVLQNINVNAFNF